MPIFLDSWNLQNYLYKTFLSYPQRIYEKVIGVKFASNPKLSANSFSMCLSDHTDNKHNSSLTVNFHLASKGLSNLILDR